MDRTANALILTLGSIASIIGFTNCSRDNNKVADNPVGPSTPSTPDAPNNPGTTWNTISLDEIVSSSVSYADVSIAVLGSYNPATTTVEIDGIPTSNYTTETIDQAYTLTVKVPIGKFTIRVSDSDDSRFEQRNVTVKPSYSKDIFNTVYDLRASSYKADVESTAAKAVGVNKALGMFQQAIASLSPAMQTVANGLINGTDVHIKYQNIDQVVFGTANVYLIDKQGRAIVPKFTQADVDILRSKY